MALSIMSFDVTKMFKIMLVLDGLWAYSLSSFAKQNYYISQ